MAKAVKKTKKSRSTASKIMNAVASLMPHKKATKKAKANPKRKSASAKSKTSPAKGRTKSSMASKASKASKAKRTPKASKSYAETLRAVAQKTAASTNKGNDPAHAPGHRKLQIAGLKKSGSQNGPTKSTLMKNNSKADRIHQTESAQRQIGRR